MPKSGRAVLHRLELRPVGAFQAREGVPGGDVVHHGHPAALPPGVPVQRLLHTVLLGLVLLLRLIFGHRSGPSSAKDAPRHAIHRTGVKVDLRAVRAENQITPKSPRPLPDPKSDPREICHSLHPPR
jgi:hypothetical protein